ncbi:sugar-binding protein [Saccharicrinis sp. FJH54]|uniref:sugar-binding protein n=1 Tax=Saccharicrinis sp. FJH54 TaxID=3344665 RepID=UPI0035D4C11A
MKKIYLLLPLFLALLSCNEDSCNCENDVNETNNTVGWNKTYFLTSDEWESVHVNKNFEFIYNTKQVSANLKIANDNQNIYILLYIFNDDYYLGKNEEGEWADDRFAIVFDEKGDHIFTELEEDMLTFRTSDFHVQNTNFISPFAANGDWYYENSEKDWEYSKELDWEMNNILDQRSKGGPDAKEIYMSHSMNFINGEEQDFQFEIKIPIASSDPYDLQCSINDSIGISVTMSNGADGIASFPQNSNSYSPDNYLIYHLNNSQ